MKHLIMCTAGHIDHGKTSLIKALTGFDCDTHPQEKERGITINPGFTHIDLNVDKVKHRLGIVDVPGHHRFIKNMLAGASGVDFTLMVIAADDGVMPQTKEHLAILSCLDIKGGIIALTKADKVDEDVLEMVKEDIAEHVRGTPLETAKVMPVSSITGEGIDELKTEIKRVMKKVPAKPKGRIYREFIDRIFSVQGFGTVITGSVLEGQVKKGDQIYILPMGTEVKVKKIERHGEEVEKIGAGDRAAINISGLKPKDYKRGQLLCSEVLETTSRIDAYVKLVEFKGALKSISSCLFFCGTQYCQAKVNLLSTKSAQAGDEVFVQLELEKPLVILPGDMFVLRKCSADETIGGGKVLDSFPLVHRKRTPEIVESLKLRRSGELSLTLKSEVNKYIQFVSLSDLSNKLNQFKEDLEKGFAQIKKEVFEIAIENEKYYLSGEREKVLFTEVIDTLQKFHKKNNLSQKGMESGHAFGEALIQKYFTSSQIVAGYLAELAKQEKIKKAPLGGYCHPDFKLEQSEEEKKMIKEMRAFIDQKGPFLTSKKEVGEYISKKYSLNDKDLKNLFSYIQESEEMKYIEESYISTQVFTNIVKDILTFLNQNSDGGTISQIRESIGSNRKSCLVFVNYCDKEGLTIRNGDIRVISDNGRKLLA